MKTTTLTRQEALMTSPIPHVIALTAVLLLSGSATGSAQSNPCSLLTVAEATKHIARGHKTYNETPDLTPVAGGAICDYAYGFGGQIGIWNAPKASENFERFLKNFRMDKQTRHPVSGVGDNAWIMFPVPEDKYKDRVAYLVATVGQKIVTVHLVARDGQADGTMGEVCRGDQSGLKPDEREGCKKVLADKSETQESLKPAVIELAKLVVSKVQAGK
jgi:hypothetical protein